MTHRARLVYVLEYKDPASKDGWSVLMCNTAQSQLQDSLLELPKSTHYRIVPYGPTTQTPPRPVRRYQSKDPR